MKKICTLLLLSCLTFAAYSQNFIWGGPGDANSEFDGGLNDWTTIGVNAVIADSAANALWTWTADGRLPNGSFWGDGGTIASASVANGAAAFNSDYLDNLGEGFPGGVINDAAFGAGPAPACDLGVSSNCPGHRGELWSPSIDCSGRASVVLKFSQSYRNFDAVTTVEVTNGTDSIAYVVNGDDETYRRDVVLDISEVAANQSDVVIKFIFEGDYYYWIIDDVQVLEKPGLDLAISDFFYPALSAYTPVSQIATDTFGFGAEVANLGANTQYDVELKVEVLRLESDNSETIVYADSIVIDSIPSGFGEAELRDDDFDSDSLGVFFAETFPPELEEGLYFVQYSTSVDGATDFNAQDNVRFAPFRVTERTYATEFVGNGNLRSGLGGSSTTDFKAGNLYTTSSASQEDYIVNSFTFAAFDNDGMAGKQVSLQLIEFNEDEVGPGFANFDFTTDATSDNAQLDVVGFNTYTFTADDDANNFVTTEILDFKDPDFNVGAPLKKGNRYFAVASYSAEGRGINHGIGIDDTDAPLYSGAFGTVFWDSEDSRWYGGFSNGPYWTFILRMEIDMATSIDETPLSDTSVKVFPNPTTEVLNLELNLEAQGHATVTLADLSGRVIQIDEIDNAQHEMKQYQIGEYAPGIYLIRVATALGTKTTRFVVTE